MIFGGQLARIKLLIHFASLLCTLKLGIVNRISSEIEKRCPVYLPFCKPIGLVKDPYNNKDYSTVEGIVTSC